MDETTQQPLESLAPQVTRLIDLRDNLGATPTEMGDDPYIVAEANLGNNKGLFTKDGLNLPPSAWEAVVAHIEGKRPGFQISNGGFEAQGVYLLDTPEAPQIVVKTLPAIIAANPEQGTTKSYAIIPENRLRETFDVDQKLQSASSDHVQLGVTTQYGCVIEPDGRRHWVEAYMNGRPLTAILNGMSASGDQELYRELNKAGEVAARALGIESGELLFVKDEVRVSWDDSQPPKFRVVVTDVADFH